MSTQTVEPEAPLKRRRKVRRVDVLFFVAGIVCVALANAGGIHFLQASTSAGSYYPSSFLTLETVVATLLLVLLPIASFFVRLPRMGALTSRQRVTAWVLIVVAGTASVALGRLTIREVASVEMPDPQDGAFLFFTLVVWLAIGLIALSAVRIADGGNSRLVVGNLAYWFVVIFGLGILLTAMLLVFIMPLLAAFAYVLHSVYAYFGFDQNDWINKPIRLRRKHSLQQAAEAPP